MPTTIRQERQLSPIQVIGGIFFLGYLAIQIALPLYSQATGRYTHFGWTMFSGRDSRPRFSVVWASGDETSLSEIVEAEGRPIFISTKVDKARFVPPYLCSRFPKAVAVKITDSRRHSLKVVPCGS